MLVLVFLLVRTTSDAAAVSWSMTISLETLKFSFVLNDSVVLVLIMFILELCFITNMNSEGFGFMFKKTFLRKKMSIAT